MKIEIYRDQKSTELELSHDGGLTLTGATPLPSHYQLDDDDIYNLIKDLRGLVMRRKLNNEWTLGTLGDVFVANKKWENIKK